MRVDLFDFDLPPDRIALRPASPRDSARLLKVEDGAISDLMYALLARRLTLPLPEIKELWSWLEPFEERSGYQRETRQAVARIFSENDLLRRALQRYVLLDLPGEKTPWQRTDHSGVPGVAHAQRRQPA